MVISSSANNKPSQSLLCEEHLKTWINESSQSKGSEELVRESVFISKSVRQIFDSFRVHKKWTINSFMFLFSFPSKTPAKLAFFYGWLNLSFIEENKRRLSIYRTDPINFHICYFSTSYMINLKTDDKNAN